MSVRPSHAGILSKQLNTLLAASQTSTRQVRIFTGVGVRDLVKNVRFKKTFKNNKRQVADFQVGR